MVMELTLRDTTITGCGEQGILIRDGLGENIDLGKTGDPGGNDLHGGIGYCALEDSRPAGSGKIEAVGNDWEATSAPWIY